VKLTTRISLICGTIALIGATPTFDPKLWSEDLDQARDAFTNKYANFDWAVFQRQADLSKLFDETRGRIAAAHSEGEARAAFDRLTRQLGDGHVDFKWPSESNPGSKDAAGGNTCADLGYDARQMGRSLASHMQGYQAVIGGASEFPAGFVTIDQRKIGVVKIGLFSPHGSPSLCESALQALKIAPTERCDDECSDKVEKWASAQMTKDFEATLVALKISGAATLLVDVTQNGGGSEWAEAALRMVTGVRVTSERVGFVRGAHWLKKWNGLAEDLRKAAATAPAADRAELVAFAQDADAKARIAATPCSSEPFWKGEHPVCAWLGEGAYATGLVGAASAADMNRKSWASLIFSPAQFPYKDGVWNGPLIVVVDGGTWSAAEEFAAVLQDNHAAVIVGAPTGGAGCGHTDGGTPTTLAHSLGVVELPDCARFRANGDNEVAGVQPDLLIGLRRYDGVDQQAKFLRDKLAEAERLATSLTR
jgi:hypothetical protein